MNSQSQSQSVSQSPAGPTPNSEVAELADHSESSPAGEGTREATGETTGETEEVNYTQSQTEDQTETPTSTMSLEADENEIPAAADMASTADAAGAATATAAATTTTVDADINMPVDMSLDLEPESSLPSIDFLPPIPMTATATAAAEQVTRLEEMIFQVASGITMDLGAPNPSSQFRKKPAAKSFTKKSADGSFPTSTDSMLPPVNGTPGETDSIVQRAAKRAVDRAIKATPVHDAPKSTTGSKTKPRPARAAAGVSPKKVGRPASKAKTVLKDASKKSPSRRSGTTTSNNNNNNVKSNRNDPVWEGRPDDEYPGDGDWPEGWMKRIYERTSGASAGHTDRYWYTPVLNHKLRSMVEIRRWLEAMTMTNGDEEKAKGLYKNIVV